MEYLSIAIKTFVFLSMLNVWVVRFNQPTPWRGGSASSMKEEFMEYGLSLPTLYLVGGLKLFSSFLIFLSIWIPSLANYGAPLLALLMLGAIVMHVKIKDSFKKSIPALSFFILSIIIILLK